MLYIQTPCLQQHMQIKMISEVFAFYPTENSFGGDPKYPTKCPHCVVVLCGDPDAYPTENSFGGDPVLSRT